MKSTFKASGRVQGVMFRYTFVTSAMRRGLQAGATNNPQNQNEVWCTLEGKQGPIDSFLSELLQTRPLNSWLAEVFEITHGHQPHKKQGHPAIEHIWDRLDIEHYPLRLFAAARVAFTGSRRSSIHWFLFKP